MTPTSSPADSDVLLENGISGASELQADSTVVTTVVTTVLDVTGGMEGIERGLKSVMEGSAVLMNALDELAKLHPFVGGMYCVIPEDSALIFISSCRSGLQGTVYFSFLNPPLILPGGLDPRNETERKRQAHSSAVC